MSRYGDAEDNAAMLARFPAGFATLEASWTRVHNGPSPRLTLHRTRGTIAYDGDKIGIWREKGAEAPCKVETGEASPPAARPWPPSSWHLETFEPLQPLLDKSRNLKTMAILDARIRSAKSGAAEAIQRM